MATAQRNSQLVTIKELDGGVLYEEGIGHGMFKELKGKVKVGDTLVMETRGFSQITGFKFPDSDEWLMYKTDEDLAEEHRKFLEDLAKRRRKELKKNRASYEKRTAALPQWIRERVEHFHAKGGETFELEGWGYELAIAELAVLYAEHGFDEDKDSEVMKYAREHGTSGNQHDFARGLARAHAQSEESLAGTIGGLSPISGDPYYEGVDK